MRGLHSLICLLTLCLAAAVPLAALAAEPRPAPEVRAATDGPGRAPTQRPMLILAAVGVAAIAVVTVGVSLAYRDEY